MEWERVREGKIFNMGLNNFKCLRIPSAIVLISSWIYMNTEYSTIIRDDFGKLIPNYEEMLYISYYMIPVGLLFLITPYSRFVKLILIDTKRIDKFDPHFFKQIGAIILTIGLGYLFANKISALT